MRLQLSEMLISKNSVDPVDCPGRNHVYLTRASALGGLDQLSAPIRATCPVK